MTDQPTVVILGAASVFAVGFYFGALVYRWHIRRPQRVREKARLKATLEALNREQPRWDDNWRPG